MGDSYEILATLERLGSRLDLIESALDDISSTVSELSSTVSGIEVQGAAAAEELAAIRRDIDELEPGII